jgi:hypothetical protein
MTSSLAVLWQTFCVGRGKVRSWSIQRGRVRLHGRALPRFKALWRGNATPKLLTKYQKKWPKNIWSLRGRGWNFCQPLYSSMIWISLHSNPCYFRNEKTQSSCLDENLMQDLEPHAITTPELVLEKDRSQWIELTYGHPPLDRLEKYSYLSRLK